jgi:hypothetical protein
MWKKNRIIFKTEREVDKMKHYRFGEKKRQHINESLPVRRGKKQHKNESLPVRRGKKTQYTVIYFYYI